MGIIINQFILNEKKKFLYDLKNEVPGFGISLSLKLGSLCGLLPDTYGYKISTNLLLKFERIFQSYKGLYDYIYFSYRKLFNKLRLNDKAYCNLRIKCGYPICQRTRSNAKTAQKRLSLNFKDSLQRNINFKQKGEWNKKRIMKFKKKKKKI